MTTNFLLMRRYGKACGACVSASYDEMLHSKRSETLSPSLADCPQKGGDSLRV